MCIRLFFLLPFVEISCGLSSKIELISSYLLLLFLQYIQLNVRIHITKNEQKKADMYS